MKNRLFIPSIKSLFLLTSDGKCHIIGLSKSERTNAMMNPRELDVLNILWKSDEPMMATDIVNAGDGLTQSTVTAVLRKLLHAKLVEVAGVTHSGKVLSRTYRPSESSREIILQDFTDNYTNFRDIISKSTLFAALLDSNRTPEENKKDVAEMKSMLKEYEQKYSRKK